MPTYKRFFTYDCSNSDTVEADCLDAALDLDAPYPQTWPGFCADRGEVVGIAVYDEDENEIYTEGVCESPPPKAEQREQLADLEHQQWAHWTKYMLDTLTIEIGAALHGVLAPDDYKQAIEAITGVNCLSRWLRQTTTPYAELTEKEKDSDREWADKALAIIGA